MAVEAPMTPPVAIQPRTRSRAIVDAIDAELARHAVVLDRATLRAVTVEVKLGAGNRIRAILVNIQTETIIGG